MVGLNRVMIIGNLGQDPEMKYTANGQAVTNFSVAVTRNYTGNDGERHEETEWFRVVAWAKLAEQCSQFLAKGRKVYVEGRLQTRSWEAQDGEKKYRTEVNAQSVLFLDRGPGGPGGPGGGDRYEPAGGGGDRYEPAGGPPDMDIEDLPFE